VSEAETVKNQLRQLEADMLAWKQEAVNQYLKSQEKEKQIQRLIQMHSEHDQGKEEDDNVSNMQQFDDAKSKLSDCDKTQSEHESFGCKNENEREIKYSDVQQLITRQAISSELPEFSGDPLQWPLFYSQYVNSTKMCGFSDYENIVRLTKALSGRAKEAVQTLFYLPNNCSEIIKILKSRFGDSRHIIRNLLSQVKNFSVIREDKTENLVRFYDHLTNLVYTLKTLEENDNLRNPSLFEEILNKLPMTHRLSFMQFYDEHQSKEPRLIVLHKWLAKKANAAVALGFGKVKGKGTTLTVYFYLFIQIDFMYYDTTYSFKIFNLCMAITFCCVPDWL